METNIIGGTMMIEVEPTTGQKDIWTPETEGTVVTDTGKKREGRGMGQIFGILKEIKEGRNFKFGQ